ncbi:carbon storage regulator CsrA [Paenibacillus sp. NPDC058174]|uniref:carbon storage regulator CsrA n=1 Tax=Paenibacillus sp. NPDC058174 TaxID=3346366 RepID=UPI0036DD473A
MLVLARKKGESLLIGEDIEISILEVQGDVVKIGIKAPKDVPILRKELYAAVEEMNRAAEQSAIDGDLLKNQLKNIKKHK